MYFSKLILAAVLGFMAVSAQTSNLKTQSTIVTADTQLPDVTEDNIDFLAKIDEFAKLNTGGEATVSALLVQVEDTTV